MWFVQPSTPKLRSIQSLAAFRAPSKQLKTGYSSRRGLEVKAALFDPPPFDPAKLTVRYLPCLSAEDALLPRRRYTLTHNDLTGTLNLSIGSNYNKDQLSGWYTRILRDEVLAEWHIEEQQPNGEAVLHVYCHVSGEESWPAPPYLRSFIFQREMTLVLDTIKYADRELIAVNSQLADATIYVHLRSDRASLNRIIEWGTLGDKDSWQRAAGGGMLQQVFNSILASFSSMDDDDYDGNAAAGGFEATFLPREIQSSSDSDGPINGSSESAVNNGDSSSSSSSSSYSSSREANNGNFNNFNGRNAASGSIPTNPSSNSSWNDGDSNSNGGGVPSFQPVQAEAILIDGSPTSQYD